MTETAPFPAVDLFEQTFFTLASECSVEAWLNFLGHRWNALILYQLSLGLKRFGELSSSLPTVTPKVLSERLAALEARGLVERTASSREAPYGLSSSGEALMPILHALELWARDT